MTISKNIYLILPLFIIYIFHNITTYKDDTFLYDDAPITLSYSDVVSTTCPNELSIIQREEFPVLVLNFFGNCLPVLHTERTGALAFNIVNFFEFFLSKKSSIQVYKLLFSLLLLFLYFKLVVQFSKHLKIDLYFTTYLFFFSPYFFFMYEPYLVEKTIPPAIVLIHLGLFSRTKYSNFLAGLLSSLFLFFIKLTFLFELLPVWFLHYFYFKNINLKKYLIGFIVGLAPLLIANLIFFSEKWSFLVKDIIVFEHSFIQNIPNLLELIFIPSSFYLSGLFYQPNYNELTEYLPTLTLIISLIISMTYIVKNKDKFPVYLIISILACFLFSYFSIMSKAKGNSVIYISSIGLYIPILINYGLSRYNSNNYLKRFSTVLQILLIGLFFYTIAFEVPNFEIISSRGTKSYEKISHHLKINKVNKVLTDNIERLNTRYFNSKVQTLPPNAKDLALKGSSSFAVVTSDLEKFHPYLKKSPELGRFKESSVIINQNQGTILYLFLIRN